MKKAPKIILNLFVLSAFIVGGVGISYNTALTMQTQVETQSVAEPLSKNGEQDKKAPPTGSSLIDDSKLRASPQNMGEEPRKKTTQAVDQIHDRFALLGTVVGNKDYALAIIEDKALRTQRLYKIGHSLYGGVITEILREKVTIRLHGKDLVFKMGGGGSLSGDEDVGPKLEEERRLVRVSLRDMQDAFDAFHQPTSGARLVRRSSDMGIGKAGLQLCNVQPGSIFEKMGFKEGDLIEEINGNPIKDPYNAVAMFNLMKSVLPADILFESGLDLESFLNGTDNRMSVILQKMQKLFYLSANRKDVQLTLSVKRNRKRQ